MATPRSISSSVLALSIASLVSSGCYSWDVGPSDAASHDAGGERADAQASHVEAGAPPRDAGRATADATAVLDAGHPSPPDASCASLLATTSAARAEATTCTQTTPPQCTMSVADECGCQVFVATTSSAATLAYTTAVSKERAAGCTPTCSQCPAVAGALCLPADSDSGTTLIHACSPYP
jgi:hypothetical protein